MLTKEQVAERVNYLGSSDAAAVLGLSRWKSPLEVWGEKTGAIVQDDISDELPIVIGNELEDVVARLFAKRTGKKVHRVNEVQAHPKYPFLRAQIDRKVEGEDSVLECKTAGAWKAREWEGDEIPQEYIVQVMHQLAVTGKAVGYIAVLIGGNVDFVWKQVVRNDDAIQQMIAREVEFWTRYVEPRVMPKIVTPDDKDVLFKLFPKAKEEAEPILLGDEAERIVESIESMGRDANNLARLIDKERNMLRLMLGDKAVGLTPKYKISWKNQGRTDIDGKKLREERPDIAKIYERTSEMRVLRIKSLNGKEE